MKKKWLVIILVMLGVLFLLQGAPGLYMKLLEWQKILLKNMKMVIRLEEGGSFWLVLAITFTYGMIHSLGPGHGKSFLSTYVLKTKVEAWKIISMTAIIAYLQGFLAYMFVRFVIDLASRSSMLVLYTIDQKTRLLSASMIVLIGIFDIFLFFKKKEETTKEYWIFSFVVGLCPCPGVMSVLLFIVLLGYESYSFLFAFSTASGIFVMLTFFGLAAGKLKKYMTLGSSEKLHQRFQLFGAFLLIIIGGLQIISLLDGMFIA